MCCLEMSASVQWVATRSEDLLAGMQGRGSVLEGRLHVNAQGELQGLWARLHFTLGAWLPFSAVVPLRIWASVSGSAEGAHGAARECGSEALMSVK